MDYINEQIKKTPVVINADVVVVGGGPAGVGAAIRAARSGFETVIIERFGSLGGIITNGYMFIVHRKKHLPEEIYTRLRKGGYIVNLLEKYPDLISDPFSHYSHSMDKENTEEILAFNPDMCSCIINEMLEETNVKIVLDTLFVDAVVEDGSIKAVIIENASGRQAIKGRIYIDTTGRADVIARTGAPYIHPENELGKPIPMGLMWRMSGVDYAKLLEYQKEDPKLSNLIEKAKKNGELSYYRPKKTEKEMKHYDINYTGHPCPEFSPILYDGDMLMWAPAIYEWGLNGAENNEDLTRAELHIRKQIVSEIVFFKKYVPGFERAHLSGIAPFMGIREGRHPVGEYTLAFDDVKNSKKFEDTVLRLKASNFIDMTNKKSHWPQFEIPYRSILPKNINNLLLAGDDIAVDHGAFLHIRGFGKAMNLGEVAGVAAAVAIRNKTKIKETNISLIQKDLMKYGIL